MDVEGLDLIESCQFSKIEDTLRSEREVTLVTYIEETGFLCNSVIYSLIG